MKAKLAVNVRLYVLEAINLTPQDANGKADPYLLVELGTGRGKQTIDCVKEHHDETLNPAFHRAFDIYTELPGEWARPQICVRNCTGLILSKAKL